MPHTHPTQPSALACTPACPRIPSHTRPTNPRHAHRRMALTWPLCSSLLLSAPLCSSLLLSSDGQGPSHPSMSFSHLPWPSLLGWAGTLSFLNILILLWPSVILWGSGTAIGELPPYFITRAAKRAGTRATDYEAELEEAAQSTVRTHAPSRLHNSCHLDAISRHLPPNPATWPLSRLQLPPPARRAPSIPPVATWHALHTARGHMESPTPATCPPCSRVGICPTGVYGCRVVHPSCVVGRCRVSLRTLSRR